MYFSKHRHSLTLATAVALPLIFSGCADLRLAKTAFKNGQYDEARAHWSVLSEKGFPQAEVGLGRLLIATQTDKNAPEHTYRQALSYFQVAYDKGYQAAALDIGLTHLKLANTLPSDSHFQDAYQWLTRASNNGQKNADVYLANMQLEGQGTPQDIGSAISTLEALAASGNGRAARQLGEIYEAGHYLDPNDELAVNWYEQAIQLGDPAAEFRLARLYENSKGDVQNTKHALALYEKLAKQNHIAATYRLARLLESINGPSEPSRHWYSVAARQGHMASQLRLANIHFEEQVSPQEIQKALNTYRHLSTQGSAAASYRLGQAYEKGVGVAPDDERAFQWYSKALQQGHVRAELRLARFYASGQGIPQDLNKARTIYQRFAQQGDASAAYHLAELLYEANDNEAAYPWYEAAANAHHPAASYKFGMLLSQSENPQDINKAEQYLTLAALNGYHRAALVLGQQIFSGWRDAPDDITGLALVLTAARHHTRGAVASALALMDQMHSSHSIEQANACSRRLHASGYSTPFNKQCDD